MRYSTTYKLDFRKMRRLRRNGDTEGALAILRRLVKEYPDDLAAYLIIGDILWDMRRLPQASKQFRLTCRRFPKSEIASRGLFDTLWDQSKTDAAFKEMKRFQIISNWHCEDYTEIVREILQKG